MGRLGVPRRTAAAGAALRPAQGTQDGLADMDAAGQKRRVGRRPSGLAGRPRRPTVGPRPVAPGIPGRGLPRPVRHVDATAQDGTRRRPRPRVLHGRVDAAQDTFRRQVGAKVAPPHPLTDARPTGETVEGREGDGGLRVETRPAPRDAPGHLAGRREVEGA